MVAAVRLQLEDDAGLGRGKMAALSALAVGIQAKCGGAKIAGLDSATRRLMAPSGVQVHPGWRGKGVGSLLLRKCEVLGGPPKTAQSLAPSPFPFPSPPLLAAFPRCDVSRMLCCALSVSLRLSWPGVGPQASSRGLGCRSICMDVPMSAEAPIAWLGR